MLSAAKRWSTERMSIAALKLILFCLVGLLLSSCSPAPPWRGLIKIGLVLPFHGPLAPLAVSVHVEVRQTLLDRDRAGGLAGWRLELVSLDDQADPLVGAQRIAELALDPDVVAALGPPGADADAAAARGVPYRIIPTARDGATTATALLDEIAASLAADATPTRGLRQRLGGR